MAREVVYGANLDPLPAGALGTLRFRAVGSAPWVEFRALERAAPDAEGRELATLVTLGQISWG